VGTQDAKKQRDKGSNRKPS